MLTMTHHAQARLQQRGIPHNVIENLLDFGHEAHSHNGSRIVYFDHRARQQLRRQFGTDSYKRIEPYLLMPTRSWPILGKSLPSVTVPAASIATETDRDYGSGLR
jgi:hypothetical protein